MALRWFDSTGGNLHHNLSIFVSAAAVREDSEQHNAHHGKAWHQVRAPGWATSLSSNDTNVTNINWLHSIHLMTTKKETTDHEYQCNLCNLLTKKVENNKSTFYLKINGFLFGSLKNNHYLCISERNNIINH